ncbi:hypothetical protein, partial [Chromobacterium haemolyticum]|uniref:hypothetical protein n=1 Tax=Chromobacterium haemolyticum TaxID=394935 RepID=UPI0019666C3A
KFAVASNVQPVSPDLTALADLKGTGGFYVSTGPGTAVVRTLNAGQGVTVNNGDGKAGNPTVALAASGVAAGSYGMVTVDVMGRVTAGRGITSEDVPPLDWSKITSGKPTTLAGYGINDAVPVDVLRRGYVTSMRAEKGLPTDDESAVGFAFGLDGNTGLFALGGVGARTGTTELQLHIDGISVFSALPKGLWHPQYGFLHEKFVSDVRLGAVEFGQLWRGPGYSDTAGYVITGVMNYENDELADKLARDHCRN